MRKISLLMLVAFAAIFASACEKKGPAERAGEKIDDAMSDMADAAENMGDEVESAVDDLKEDE
jgi:outer membrane lipoprotein-sorting protein